MSAKKAKKEKAHKPTSRVYVVTGTTNPLNDGIQRDVTLVAVVETEADSEVYTSHRNREEGNKSIFTTVKEKVDFVKTTVHIGLAVVSPVDKAFTAQYNSLLEQAGLPTTSTGEMEIAKQAKADADEMLKKNSSSLVTEQRGIEIAVGKAIKRKTTIATIVTNAPFFGKTMVVAILGVKIQQICEDPDRFIRVTPVDAVTKELAQRIKLEPSDPNASAKQPAGPIHVREVEHA